MNRLLALCTSPDQGGLELYLIKFIKHYDNDKNVYVACSKNSYISKNICTKKIECGTYGFFNSISNFFRIRRYIINNNIHVTKLVLILDIIFSFLFRFYKKYNIFTIIKCTWF